MRNESFIVIYWNDGSIAAPRSVSLIHCAAGRGVLYSFQCALFVFLNIDVLRVYGHFIDYCIDVVEIVYTVVALVMWATFSG